MNQNVIPVSGDITLHLSSPSHSKELFRVVDENRSAFLPYLHWPRFIQTSDDTKRFLDDLMAKQTARTALGYLIITRGEIVGFLSFNTIDWEAREAVIGYWLAQEAQGKGVMSQSVLALCRHTFEHSPISTIILRTASHNRASQQLAIRCGFAFSKQLTQSERIGSLVYDQYEYRLTKPPVKQPIY